MFANHSVKVRKNNGFSISPETIVTACFLAYAVDQALVLGSGALFPAGQAAERVLPHCAEPRIVFPAGQAAERRGGVNVTPTVFFPAGQAAERCR